MGRSGNLIRFCQFRVMITSSLLLVLSLLSRPGLSEESPTLTSFNNNKRNFLKVAQNQPLNIPPQVPQPDPNRDRFIP
ncbi:MAG: hypothetical protein ACKPFF_12465, partial [Planktothrix sp.]